MSDSEENKAELESMLKQYMKDFFIKNKRRN